MTSPGSVRAMLDGWEDPPVDPRPPVVSLSLLVASFAALVYGAVRLVRWAARW